MDNIITMMLLILMSVFFAVIYSDNTVNAIIISGLLSSLNVILYIMLKAPDVAITEASIGSGISTLIYILGLLYVKDEREVKQNTSQERYFVYATIFVSIIFISFIAKMPKFGDSQNIVHKNIAEFYLNNTHIEYGFNDIVTAILGGYRGFDTMFETLLIVITGIGIRKILNQK